jgi:hypothetical protein
LLVLHQGEFVAVCAMNRAGNTCNDVDVDVLAPDCMLEVSVTVNVVALLCCCVPANGCGWFGLTGCVTAVCECSGVKVCQPVCVRSVLTHCIGCQQWPGTFMSQ